MATHRNGDKPVNSRRGLIDLQFNFYRRVVERKHGLPVPLSPEDAAEMSDEELSAYVDSLRDIAHLPPA